MLRRCNYLTLDVKNVAELPPERGSYSYGTVSRDGKYWIGDTSEKGIPIYIGCFATGRCRRACFTRTEYDGKRWSHAHPYLTADNKWLIFGARRNGHPQTHGAKLKPGWLENL